MKNVTRIVLTLVGLVGLTLFLPIAVQGLVNTENAASSFSESLSCTVTGGTCQVTTSGNITTLNSVTQTVPISADKTGDSTVGGDNRTITITSIASS